MPDRLESLLRGQQLDIAQPPLTTITRRAASLRRRRRGLRVGAVLLAAVVAVGGVAAVMSGWRDRAPQPATSAEPQGGVWRAGGITVLGLPHPPADLPGRVQDGLFVDPGRGYLLSVDCPQAAACNTWVHASSDGGDSWTSRAVPFAGSPTAGSPTTGSPGAGSLTTGSPNAGSPTAGSLTAGGGQVSRVPGGEHVSPVSHRRRSHRRRSHRRRSHLPPTASR